MSPWSHIRTLCLTAALASGAALIAACEQKSPAPRFVGQGEETAETDARPLAKTEDVPEGYIPAERQPVDAATRAARTPLLGLLWKVPSNWEARPAPSAPRAAEFTVFPAGDDYPVGSAEDVEFAECIVFTFGPSGAGSAEANIERWARLIRTDSSEEPPRLIDLFVAESDPDLLITFIATSGTFMSGPPGQPPVPRKNWSLLGAVIEGGPMGPVYVRLTGPEAVVESNHWRFIEVMHSLLVDDQATASQ